MKLFDKQNALRDLRNAFIAGIALLTPIAVTIFLIYFLVTRIGEPTADFIIEQIYGQLESSGQPNPLRIVINIGATVVVFVAITALGFFSRYALGKWLFGIGEKLISAVPLVNTVYTTVKQIVDTFSEQQKAIFQKVVMIEYPRTGCFAIGFLTSESKGETQAKTGKEVANVFVPTTPNPTSGFLLILPRDEITELEMSIGEGMKLIISGGAVSPPYPRSEPEAAPAKRPPKTTRPHAPSDLPPTAEPLF
ncbi:MAG: DUF502 domain-containing protein [Opitutales bacterium]